MIQDYFFTDNTRQKYDFNRIILFNLLYSGGKDEDKLNFFYSIIETSSSSIVENNSPKLINTIDNLTYISCVTVGEILGNTQRFSNDQEDMDFSELMTLFQTNSSILREFAIYMINMYLFPSSEMRQYLNKQEFAIKMQQC